MIIACATFEQKFTVRAHTFDTKQVLSIVTKFMMVLGSHGFSGSGRICLGSPQCLPSLSLDACQAACECISIDNPGCCEWRTGGLTKNMIILFYHQHDKKLFYIWFETHHMPFCAFTLDNSLTSIPFEIDVSKPCLLLFLLWFLMNSFWFVQANAIKKLMEILLAARAIVIRPRPSASEFFGFI